MKSQKEKRNDGWSSLPWKRVALEDEEVLPYNHYDDDDDDRADPRELVEDSNPAILWGLEVLDGSQYTAISGSTRNRQDNDDNDDMEGQDEQEEDDVLRHSQGKKKPTTTLTEDDEGAESQEEKKEKKKKKKTKEEEEEEEDAEAKARRKRTKRRNERRKRKRLQEKQKQEEEEEEKEPSVDGDGEEGDEEEEDYGQFQQEKKAKILAKTTTTTPTGAVSEIGGAWCRLAGGVWLHEVLCDGLSRMGCGTPTPIQAATLPAAVLGRCDVVGAAPTGSGKTLAYALPLLHRLLEDDARDSSSRLRALVLCPTRELALQVTREMQRVSLGGGGGVSCGTLVGGLSAHKQARILQVVRPAILVATPGRLWELMSRHEYPHLNNLSRLEFLVIDEADRMIRQGSFPQLTHIFQVLRQWQGNPKDDDETQEEEEDDDMVLALQGLAGEAKVSMLTDDILAQVEEQRKDETVQTLQRQAAEEEQVEEEGEEQDGDEDKEKHEDDDDDEEEEEEVQAKDDSDSDAHEEMAPVHRQTFVFSATLTLPSSAGGGARRAAAAAVGKKQRPDEPPAVEGAIAEILEKAGACGRLKIVHMAGPAVAQDAADSLATRVSFPPGLSLYQVSCRQAQKDAYLYAYCTTVRRGPTLVFCNSIAGVKRVTATLQTLGLPAQSLHAQMVQKARLRAVESLAKKAAAKNKRGAIVVATDVAARGLDLPLVQSVVHYDVARALDTFVHRAGRTARGVGEHAVGWSVSLVSAAEEDVHMGLCRAATGKTVLDEVPFLHKGDLWQAAQERVGLASRVVAWQNAQQGEEYQQAWFRGAAQKAGLDWDEEQEDDDEGRHGPPLQNVQAKLRALLAQPLPTNLRHGAFLTGDRVALAAAAALQQEEEETQASNESRDKTHASSSSLEKTRTSKKKKKKRKMDNGRP